MIRFILFLAIVTTSLAGKCSLRFEENHAAIFLSTFGSKHILLETKADRVEWDNRDEIIGYCPGGFSSLPSNNQESNNQDYYDSSYDRYATYEYSETSKQILLSCSGNTNFFRAARGNRKRSFSNDRNISCDTAGMYYETSIPGCDGHGLAYGFFFQGDPIILADICYSLQSMQLQFIHYVAGPRSAVLKYHMTMNSVNVTETAETNFFNCIHFDEEKRILSETISNALPKLKGALEFTLDDLLPVQTAGISAGSYVKDLKCVNMIPWWSSLKYGNWRFVEEAVQNLAIEGTYDIYVGISDVMVYPADEKFSLLQQLTYKVNNSIRKVPMYVWKYIKDKQNDTDEGVVIVGINSPFFHHMNGSTEFCADICGNISWLSRLHEIRKNYVFGYVFCCNPAEVMQKFNNFPRIKDEEAKLSGLSTTEYDEMEVWGYT